MPSTRPLLVSILETLVLCYLLLCLAMWGFQRHLLYLPERPILSPQHYGLTGFTEVRVRAGDGVALQLWQHPARRGFPTLVYFHGNGGNLSDRVHYDWLLTEAGFGLVALSYRGYGHSEGTPSEQGFYRDARAAMRYATDTLNLKPAQIVLYGESIGTGVAVQMATEFPVAALVLQSPYTSITDLARDRYPWLPSAWLLKDRFESLAKIAAIHTPLLLFHGERDTIVPVRYARLLYARAADPKQALFLKDTGHADFDLAALAQALARFCQAQGIITAKPVSLPRGN